MTRAHTLLWLMFLAAGLVLANFAVAAPAATSGSLTGFTAKPSGTVNRGSSNVFIGGRPAARTGDTASCTPNAAGMIVTGSPTVLINGQRAARQGDEIRAGRTSCSILTGDNSVQIQ